MSTTMEQIEELTKAFADRTQSLATALNEYDAELQELNGRFRERITVLSGLVAAAKATLHAELWRGRALFEKPRTREFSGYTVGLTVAKGKIEFANDDEERVIELIERHFPDLASVLISVKKSPNKAAINELEAAQLKRIGVTITGTGDAVVIRGVASDLEKAAKAIIESTPGTRAEPKARKTRKAVRRAA